MRKNDHVRTFGLVRSLSGEVLEEWAKSKVVQKPSGWDDARYLRHPHLSDF